LVSVFIFLCMLLFPEAMKDNLCVGVSGASSFLPSEVVTMPPASATMSRAAAVSVTRSLPLMSTKASVVPSAT